MTADDLFDEDSPLVRALVAPASAEELRGEGAAVLAYRTAMRRPRLRRRALRIASGIGMTAAASGLLVPMTAVTAAAYSAALPHRVQRAAHQLFHRLGVPAPHRAGHARQHATSGLPRGAWDAGCGATATRRPTDLMSHHRSGVLVVRVQGAGVPVGRPAHMWVQLLDGGHPVGRVTLEQRAPGSTNWSPRQSFARTPSGGAAAVLCPLAHAPEVTGSLVVPGRPPLVSATVLVRGRSRLTVFRGDRAAGGRGRIGLECVTEAEEEGRVMRLGELVAGHWHDVQQAVVDSSGRAAFGLRTGEREGRITLRCALAGSARYDASASVPFALSAAGPA